MRVKTGVASLLLAALLVTSSAQAADWYQIDIILFKPKVTDLDDETWPEVRPVYPANVISVHEPGVFRLSQLEQVSTGEDLEIEQSDSPTLASDDFVFQSASRSNRNRRVIEKVTGNGNESDDETGVDAAAGTLDAATIEQIISDAIAGYTADSAGARAFERVDDNTSLEKILRSLRFSSRYDVIEVQSWVQPLQAAPSPVMIQAGERYDDRFELEGTLSFRRSRFLHVDTDLWYTVFEAREGAGNPYVQGFSSSLPDPVLRQYPALVDVERTRGQFYPARMHVMNQSRRMRSEEIHYLDHPLFGLVIQITEVAKPTNTASRPEANSQSS